ncbi:MAG: zinc ABC transporter substrate-binding protein [Ruminococcus sp.]|nr:zinc ABC transporter substrate-binding protein [Ruminococcus sp.]
MSKKLFLSALALACAVSCFTGCSERTNSANAAEKTEKLSIVCTVFPEYDWIRTILGEHQDEVNVTYLLANGNDMHSFQPTADDIIKISSCDIFVCTGGESEEWTQDVLESAVNKDMKVVNLLDVLGDSAKEEELKDGMQGEEESEEEEVEYDEHVWLSLRNAEVFCEAIENTLSSADPANSQDYKKNLESYTAELEKLDSEFEELFNSCGQKTLVFADRFPFRYFTEDYGLDYYAAFSGCSADTEASFDTITFLANKIEELDCNAVFEIETSDGSVAKAVVNNSKNNDCDIVRLNSIQSVKKSDVENGATYLSLMNENYSLLREHLS